MDSSFVRVVMVLMVMANCAVLAVVDPCDSRPCGNGVCTSDPDTGEYKCECNDGYVFDGDTCVQDGDVTNACEPNPCGEYDCEDHGNGQYKCHCDGYQVENGPCKETIDPCVPNPCGANGECVPQSDGGYYCNCKDGYIFQNGTCVLAKCPDCYQGQCKDDPDMSAVAPGLMRTKTQLRKEMPEECSISFVEDGDERGKVECRENVEKGVIYSSDHRRWLWGDGNCCCPAHRYMWCPRRLYWNGRWVEVIRTGNGRQCWQRALCGLENGICRYRCVHVYSTIVVMVCDLPDYKYPRCYVIHYRYPTSCRCTDCHGHYCKAGFYLGHDYSIKT